MFQLDDNFLKELGLDNLPAEQKTAFLQHIYSELELRVGTRLAEGLSDSQMAEFEGLIDRDHDKIVAWLDSNLPNYKDQEDFKRLVSAVRPPDNHEQAVSNDAILSEYAATKWLELNRPDYRDVVAAVLAELKGEIIANRDHIIGGSQVA